MSADNDQVVNDLYSANMRLAEERDRWRNLCLKLSEVVKTENRLPGQDMRHLKGLREEWPSLWLVIDEIMEMR